MVPKVVVDKATPAANQANVSNNDKNSGNRKRGNDSGSQEKKKHKKGEFFKIGDLTPINDTPGNIFLATKDVVSFPDAPKVKMSKAAANSGRFCASTTSRGMILMIAAI